jgi:methylated-DNA-[protein]-cysteine S-methyltransferase
MPRKKPDNNFTEAVLRVVQAIPKGSTLSYGEVAKRAGSPGAARAVGTIMAHNYRKDVPCHRVIKADGTPGAYNRGGEEAKRAILLSESNTIKHV